MPLWVTQFCTLARWGVEASHSLYIYCHWSHMCVDARIKNKFWGKSMEVFPLGKVNMVLPKWVKSQHTCSTYKSLMVTDMMIITHGIKPRLVSTTCWVVTDGLRTMVKCWYRMAPSVAVSWSSPGWVRVQGMMMGLPCVLGYRLAIGVLNVMRSVVQCTMMKGNLSDICLATGQRCCSVGTLIIKNVYGEQVWSYNSRITTTGIQIVLLYNNCW